MVADEAVIRVLVAGDGTEDEREGVDQLVQALIGADDGR